MVFLLSLGLVVLALVLVIVGLSTSASGLLVLAAFASGGAVVLLWRRSVADREEAYLTNPPTRSRPDWDRRRRVPAEGDSDSEPIQLDDARDLGIPAYDELVGAEIMPSLETLSVEQLRAVIEREENGLRRQVIIERAKRLIELASTEINLRPEPAPVSAAPDKSKRQRKSLEKDGPDLSL